MVQLKVIFNNSSIDLIEKLNKHFSTIDIESYNEDIFKERQKAFKIKGGYGARKTPFILVLDEDGPKKAFYSEDSSCTFDNVFKYLNNEQK